jgi:Flp pilus assembly protein TadB
MEVGTLRRTVTLKEAQEMIKERKHSLIGLTVAVAAGIVLGALAVALIFTVLAALFHVVGWLLHVAVIIAVAVGVWWLLIGRRHHSHAG